MRKLTTMLLTIALALFASAALAGDKKGHEEGMDKAKTMDGCLSDGEADGWYVLTKKKGERTKQVQVKGDDSFEDHVGHQVELTGTWVEEGEDKHFHATSMKHVAATCS